MECDPGVKAAQPLPAVAGVPTVPVSQTTAPVSIQDLLNEIHLGSVRGWAPYEKALQMRGLIKTGLVEEEVAERYRMTASEVRQQIAAADMMDKQYFPITKTIYELFQLPGTGKYIAAALGVWAMVFLASTIVSASALLGKKMGAIFRA